MSLPVPRSVLLRAALATAVLLGVHAATGFAQDSLPPWRGGLTRSLGQPERLRKYVGASIGVDWQPEAPDAVTLHALAGVSRPLGHPLYSPALSLEVYAGLRAADFDAGARALFDVAPLGVAVGADYNLARQRLGFILGLTLPIRRGGVFGAGTLVRGELSPGANGALRVATLVPRGFPAAGATRPRRDHLDIRAPTQRAEPPTELPELEASLQRVSDAVGQLGDLLVPRIDAPGQDPRHALAPAIRGLRAAAAAGGLPDGGLGIERFIRAYHRELGHAFALAAGATPGAGADSIGPLLAGLARAALRDHVLYPYDRDLGQWKTERTIDGLITYARGNFARTSFGKVAPERASAVLYVFQQLLDAVADLERRERRKWEDSRLVWLPLQLALLPEEHDTQAELDAIVERVTGVPFRDGNGVWYIINQQFQSQTIASIDSARDYHVLWIHDFKGRTGEGRLDKLSLRYVVDAYLRALTNRVAEYDSAGRLPTFMIFLDQHYYEANKGRIWLDFLERPLDAVPKLPGAGDSIVALLAQAQDQLRRAVQASRLLSLERSQYGDRWLKNLLKVHVNITNPGDLSFRSAQILPLLGTPDILLRDHRKIVFYDVTESDPYRGWAMYSGMGIGEQYASGTWEDRAVMVRGPAALSLKTQARQLLESQGIRGERIPFPLRPAAGPDTSRAPPPEGHDVRALELHNQTGFAQKQVTVAKATLYSLMPPGSVIKVPDSLWGSALFAALLTSSALRGCRVLFIAPSLAAAPSSGAMQMALAHDLFARLILLQQEFRLELAADSGMLKTGIYNPGIGTQDVGARYNNAYQNGRRTPFLRRVFPLDPSVDTTLKKLQTNLRAMLGDAPGPSVRSNQVVMPRLHLKANFFASREAWDNLIALPEMDAVFKTYVPQVITEQSGETNVRQTADSLRRVTDLLVAAHRRQLTPEQAERVVYFVLTGSANADYRSMYGDGEASVLLSGWAGVVALFDFALIANLSVWIDDLEMLDALIPPPTPLVRTLAWRLRPML